MRFDILYYQRKFMSKTTNILILAGKNATRLFMMWLVKVLMFWSIPAFGQSSVSIFVDTVQPDTLHVCKGDTVQFTVDGEYTLINNNFNTAEIGYGWSSITPGYVFQAPCDTSLSDLYYLWFGEMSPTARQLTTLDLNLESGGELSFSIKFGKQGDIPSCEGPDEAREGVSLQYSTDFGQTWHDIIYYCPNGTTLPSNPGTQMPLTYFPTSFCNWNHYTFEIPDDAMTPHTRIRWVQEYCSFFNNHYDDNWGLDNIRIVQNIGPEVQISGSGIGALSSPFIADSTLTVYAWIMTATVPPDTAAIDSMVVMVHEIPQTTILGNQELCAGETVVLYATGSFSFSWSNGQTGNTNIITPVQTQQISLTATSSYGCEAAQNLTLLVHPLPQATAVGDTICEGATAILTAGGGSSYQWSNGLNTQEIQLPAAVPSVYSVTVTDSFGCSNTAMAQVSVLSAPEPDLPDEISVCYGQQVELGVSGWSSYSWSNGSQAPTVAFYPVQNALWTVTLTNPNGCVKSDSVQIWVSPHYQVSAYSDLDTVCSGEKVSLHATGGMDYEWSNGDHGSDIEIVAENTSFYTVTISNVFHDQNCSSTVTVPIEITDCYNLYFANAFSPKGYNPIFKPVGELGDVTDYHFIIFDRWGNRVFETQDPYSGWDGTVQGNFAPTGAYVWKVRFTLKFARQFYEKAGSVLIVE